MLTAEDAAFIVREIQQTGPCDVGFAQIKSVLASRSSMAPTIHQRVNGWLWSWATGPGWCRDGSEMAKLRSDGMRVLKVQLQDNGPIPRDQADEWRAAGMKCGRGGHVDGDDPTELARWLKGERNRLALAGLDCTSSPMCSTTMRLLAGSGR